jgi:predicted ATP-dependent endonuclease of OLD family
MATKPKPAPRTGLISAIEIAYFRSFYKVYFDQIDRMNIFFGENDSGKSNVMRALNLFFNGEIDDNYGFDFDIDFSSKRADEARHAVDVRKFAYVKIWFRTPAAHRRALGNEFYVKRTWSQATVPDYHQEISRSIDTSGKRHSLTKFLSKIAFTYIPAVKGHEVYAGLLRESYNAIAESDEFSAALRAFTDQIRAQTHDLGVSLNRSLGMESELAPPTDLADLFSTLDFQTLSGGGNQMSLLRQRGDGVQARHIPEIMSFISDKDSHQFHIWGIEEPENSLSVNSALLLADRLKGIAQTDDIQLFLTTHSPAFYAVSGRGVHKRFLKNVGGDVEVLDGAGQTPRDLMQFMGDRFYLPLVAEGIEEAKAKADALQEAVNTLTA